MKLYYTTTSMGHDWTRWQIQRHEVMVLLHTGARPGTEMEAICWKHINWAKQNDSSFLTIYIADRKTGEREIVVKPFVWQYLMRIRDRRQFYLASTEGRKCDPLHPLPPEGIEGFTSLCLTGWDANRQYQANIQGVP
jgi:hypothetical protein